MKKIFSRGEDCQHFSLRKLSVGVASILIGTTFMLHDGQTVHADQKPDNDGANDDSAEVAHANVATGVTSSADTKVKVEVVSDDDQANESVKDDNAAKLASDSNVQTAKDATVVDKAANVSKQLEAADNNAAKKNNSIEKSNSVNKKTTNSENQDSDVSHETKANASGKIDNVNDLGFNYYNPSNFDDKEMAHIFKLDEPDISNDQLAKLGIDSHTYLKNGVKYKILAKAEFVRDDGDGKGDKVLYRIPFNPIHENDGSYIDLNKRLMEVISNPMNAGRLYELAGMKGSIGVYFIYAEAPYLNGKTIYINKDSNFDVNVVQRGLDEGQFEDAISNVDWDSLLNTKNNINVDTLNQNVGTYPVSIDITYKNGMSVSAQVNVVVVDLKGKTIYTNINNNISQNVADYISGIPAGSTYSWVDGAPSTAQAGTFNKQVEVVYPDGTKGTSAATIIVLNPQGTTVHTDPNVEPDVHTLVTTIEGQPVLPAGTTYSWQEVPDVSKPGSTVAGNVVVTYPNGESTVVTGKIIVSNPTKTTTESNVITRQIIDNVPGQATPTIVNQSVTYTREVTRDSNGKVTNTTNWVPSGSATWAEYQAHGADGYTPNPSTVTSVQVTPDTKSQTVTITYTKNQPSQPSQPSNPSNPSSPSNPTSPSNPSNPSSPSNPTSPSNPSNPSSPSNPSEPTTPQLPSNPTSPTSDNGTAPRPLPQVTPNDKDKNGKDNSGSDKGGNHEAETVRPHAQKNDNGKDKKNGNNNGSVRPLATKVDSNNNLKNQNVADNAKALPETGDKNDNNMLVALGSGIIASASLLGLAGGKKKRKED